ncbi:polyprenyl synthetase family protein [Micrococcales bacterium 31B]|nr:polyprenyl synthetase family protein [Micrococcales bacterium 31B]
MVSGTPESSGLSFLDESLTQALADRLANVEEDLRRAVSTTDALAAETTRHLMDAGGKRIRPLLCLLTAELGDGSRKEIIDAATVVELTHLATLYHDDVMDSAPTRRGAPSAHEVWGNSVAILTGDLLFARASRLVAGLGPQAVRVQAETFERLCLGQLHETVGPRSEDDPAEFYIQVLADKTGSLIATSARFGATFAGCSNDVIEAVTAYGEKVGVAFQLADDVIDILSDAETTGKTPGTDLREGVPTMPVLLLRSYLAGHPDDEVAADLVGRLDGDLSDDAVLAQVVRDLGAHQCTEDAHRLAQEWADAAKAELRVLKEHPVRTALENFADAVVTRLS